MKPSFYLLPLLLFQASAISANLSAPNQITYIQDHKDLAIREMLRTGIPASIILAQALLASDAGQNELALQANNHFGTPCDQSWSGNIYRKSAEDRSLSHCYRAYPTTAASFEDHSRIFTDPEHIDRYWILFRLDVTDYFGWANGLQLAGYSGNIDYAQDLIALIEAYRLFQYDIIFYTEGNLPPKYWQMSPEATTSPEAAAAPEEGDDYHRFGFQPSPATRDQVEGSYRLYYDQPRDLAREEEPEQGEPSFSPGERAPSQEPWQRPFYRHPEADHGFDQDQFAAGSRSGKIILAAYTTEVSPDTARSSQLPRRSLVTSQYHKVTRNETLWGIARQYKTSVERLKRLNNLRTDQIQNGRILRVS